MVYDIENDIDYILDTCIDEIEELEWVKGEPMDGDLTVDIVGRFLELLNERHGNT